MNVRVRMFAVARDLAGAHEVRLTLPSEARIADLRRELAAQHPELEAILPWCVFAIDEQYAVDTDAISGQSEIACIPPVSGG